MERLKCNKCGITYTDEESIKSAKKSFENWKKLCQKDGVEPKGISPCPMIRCPGELVLEDT